MNQSYSKPQMTFKSVNTNQSIAANCWDEAAAQGKPFYYDYAGLGYIEFHLAGNCGQGVSVVQMTHLDKNGNLITNVSSEGIAAEAYLPANIDYFKHDFVSHEDMYDPETEGRPS